MKKLLLFAIVILGFSAASFGQISTFATAASSATIITPLSITKVGGADLKFGNIVADEDGGTVTVTTEGERSASGLTLPAATLGVFQAAQFTVTGLANSTYSITTPDAFTVVGPEGSTAMGVSTFVTNPTPTGTLSSEGSQTIKVGATLTVNANQVAGTYTNAADLKITVAYN